MNEQNLFSTNEIICMADANDKLVMEIFVYDLRYRSCPK